MLPLLRDILSHSLVIPFTLCLELLFHSIFFFSVTGFGDVSCCSFQSHLKGNPASLLWFPMASLSLLVLPHIPPVEIRNHSDGEASRRQWDTCAAKREEVGEPAQPLDICCSHCCIFSLLCGSVLACSSELSPRQSVGIALGIAHSREPSKRQYGQHYIRFCSSPSVSSDLHSETDPPLSPDPPYQDLAHNLHFRLWKHSLVGCNTDPVVF